MQKFLLLLALKLILCLQVTAQFNSVIKTNVLPITSNTQDKTQSKVFSYDGKFWAVLPNSSGTHLWRIDGNSWTHILRLSTKTGSRADCKVVGNLVHVFMFQGSNSQLVSLEYVPGSSTYKLWSERPSIVGISLDSGVETAMIDVDGTGRMWLASDGSSTINVRWSDAPYTQWNPPVILASGVSSNDKCAVIAMPGQVGVFWSNQNTGLFGFRTHLDGAPPTSWSIDEKPASQSALNVGNGMADDHFNLAVANNGTLYSVIKTSYNKSGYPLIGLLVRRSNGSWDNLYEVSQTGTTPTVILNEAQGKIKVLYTSQTYGRDIVYRESSTSNISFSNQHTLISGTSYRDQTSTKQNYTNSIFVVASSTVDGVAIGVIASDDESTDPTSPPQVPVLSSPANNANNVSTSPTLQWQAAEGADSYQVQVATASDFSTTLINQSNVQAASLEAGNLSNSTSYYWRVRAANQAGNSAWSATWSFVTEAGNTPTGTLVGHWRMEEGSGNVFTDDSGYENHAMLQTAQGVTWGQGVDGLAVNLPGTSGRFANAASSTSLNISDAITLAVWVRPNVSKYKTIVSKINPNGYTLGMTNKAKVLFWFNYDSHGSQYRFESSSSLPTDGKTWVHIAATYDGRVAKIYINGVEDRSATFPSVVKIGANNSNFVIGALDKNERWTGGIDDLRLYNKALSATEVAALAGVSGAQTSLSTTILTQQIQSQEKTEDTAHQLSFNSNIVVYPNPLLNHAKLKYLVPDQGEYSILLYDSKGTLQAVVKHGVAAIGETGEIMIDGSKLAKGIYFIRLQTPKRSSIAFKLVVQK